MAQAWENTLPGIVLDTAFLYYLQDKGTDIATVVGMLGHTSTKYVHKTYKRYRKNNAWDAINKLPSL